MRRTNLSVAMANLVMETVAELQKGGRKATLKDIKLRIVEKQGNKAEKFMKLVPQYLTKGMNLGLIAKYGDNFRTKMYISQGRRKRGSARKRRRRRRHRRH